MNTVVLHRLSIVLSLWLFGVLLNAQEWKRGNNWTFSDSILLNFNAAGLPAVSQSAVYLPPNKEAECNATISDKDGNLLRYYFSL